MQAILDYIQTPQTDYALLITGPWGCGKTYFWKNVVEPQIQHLRLGDGQRRPLYASLYGCQSARDVDTQLFLESHPHLKKKWATRLTSLGGSALNQLLKAFTRFELPAIDLRWLINTKNAVLCFDDLERSRLPMKEALGYINTFVEHERVKVIILCNEDAISDEDDKKTYGAMKEKVVGASLAFRPELGTVFQTLIDEYRSRGSFHGFLSKNAELPRRLFDRSETQNIRSLRRALSALAVIFDALDSHGIDPSAIAKQLIYAVAPTAFELHGGAADPEDLRAVHANEHMAIPLISASPRLSKRTREKKYEEIFAERYLRNPDWSEWYNAVGCLPICEFLLTGVLDRPALVAWAEKLIKPPDEKEERIKRLLSDPWGMEDGEFLRTVAQVLKEVETGEISAIGSYIGWYNTFEFFANQGLIPMTQEEVFNKFSEGLRKARDNGKLVPNPELRSMSGHPSFAPKSDSGRSLRGDVLRANEDLLAHGVRQRVQVLASGFKEDATTFIDALTGEGESGLLFTPVFHELDADDTAAIILALPNPLKLQFETAIHNRYETHPLVPGFAAELPVLIRIRDILKARCGAPRQDNEPMPISLFVAQDIVVVLDEAIERLSRLQQEKDPAASGAVEAQPPKEQDTPNDDFAETDHPA